METSATSTSSGLNATCAAFHGIRRAEAAVTHTRTATSTATTSAHSTKYHCCCERPPSGTSSPTSHIARPETTGWSSARSPAAPRYGVMPRESPELCQVTGRSE